jgi:hypothetical protein
LLESSSNLVAWSPVVNLLTTNSTGPFVDYPATNDRVRFYRTRSPGVTASEAMGVWDSKKPASYRFRLQSFRLDLGGAELAGTISITGESKTVIDATLNGLPTDDFEPSDFLTIGELFGLISDLETHGTKLAHVVYDVQWSFPSSVSIIGGTASPVINYRVSDFVEGTGAATGP